MKNRYIYLTVLAALGLTACEPEFDQELEDTPIAAQESGDADFSTYVAVGASITAGYADGAVYIDGQNTAFPKLMAEKMEAAGGGTFTTPFMADNIGGFAGVYDEDENLIFNSRLVYNAATGAPELYTDSPANSITDFVTGYYNNMGIPGMKSFHSLDEDYASIAENPYFARIASSNNATVIGDAIAQDPTFFSLWLGGNDVLDYATTGGTGAVQEDTNSDPNDGDITDATYFEEEYTEALDELTSNGASGVLFNVPYVTDLPFFTTVPNNALVLDATTAASLTSFFTAFSGLYTQGLILGGYDTTTAISVGGQYAFTFSEGANLFLVSTEVTAENPLGIRQMTEDELLLLTIDTTALTQGYGSIVLTDEVNEALGVLLLGGTPTAEQSAAILGAVWPIEDADVLDSDELALIQENTDSYNSTIATLAAANTNLMLFDANALLTTLKSSGVTSEGTTVTGDISLEGAFSLDGIHLNPRGNAVFANMVMEDINDYFGSTLQLYDPIKYGTLTLK